MSTLLPFRGATTIIALQHKLSGQTSFRPHQEDAMPPKPRGKDMNATYSPQDAANQARDAFRKGAEQFEKLSLETTVPESVRALAEKTVTQTREAYEKGKDALEEAVDSLERSFDAAGQGAAAFNRKLDRKSVV